MDYICIINNNNNMCISSIKFNKKEYKLLNKGFLNEILDKDLKENKDKCYKMLVSKKGFELFNLDTLNAVNSMPKDEYNLKFKSTLINAYIHDKWNYYKFPHENLDDPYLNKFTNKIQECNNDKDF